MARTIDSSVSAELAQSVMMPVIFCALGFDDGTLYMHTDLGDIAFGGHTYLGAGDLGSIDGIEERDDNTPAGLVLRLSGIDATLLNEALTQNYYDRTATIYLGIRNTITGAMIADPFEIFVGKMDQMRVMAGAGTSTIELSVESEMIEFDRSLNRYFSDSQLQTEYAGDLGFQYMAAMVNQKITIGSKEQISIGSQLPGGQPDTKLWIRW